uniref:Mitochondrial intermembrane space import and assembly protein 40 homolog n=1 Tax=Physcomitrium patens TaxID=3218 RepID=A0A7I4A6Y9_PHYPA
MKERCFFEEGISRDAMGLLGSSNGDDEHMEEAAALVGGDDSEHDGEGVEMEKVHLECWALLSGCGLCTEQLSREERARRALKCDCVAELRDGPCGSQFKEAFYCFLTSTAEEQGSDCTKSFIAMQTCMTANPESFAQYNGEDRNQSSPGGEFTLHGNKQEGTPVASPPPGAIRKPL